jgi:hypothetical protein
VSTNSDRSRYWNQRSLGGGVAVAEGSVVIVFCSPLLNGTLQATAHRWSPSRDHSGTGASAFRLT